MRIVLATVGTRGDIQPMLALAQALVRNGDRPVVACPASFAGMVARAGVEHHALGEDLQALMRERGDKLRRSLAAMKAYFREQLLAQVETLHALSRDADAIVSTAMAWSGPSVAEKLGVPALLLLPSSCGPSKLHPPPLFPWYGLPRWLNALLWRFSDLIQDRLMGAALNEARARLALPPLKSFTRHLFLDTPCVIAADPQVFPPDPAWGDRYRYTGPLFAEDTTLLDPALDAWLSAGEPPICVGFGSMAGAQVERMETVVAEAFAGQRCLVLSGAGGLFAGARALPAGFFVAAEAPHAQLFPRVAAVVHHGGAGTVAACLRAAVPQVVAPVMLDQFHHAHHLSRAGLAPRAPKLASLSAAGLKTALAEALQVPLERRQAVAQRVRASDAGATIGALLHERLRAAARAANRADANVSATRA